MIDNNLNEKKKQPKFVIEGKYKLDEVKWSEKLPADWMFMETCRYITLISLINLGPQPPPTEKVLKFNMIFYDSTHKNFF